jgi:hypothetical protein
MWSKNVDRTMSAREMQNFAGVNAADAASTVMAPSSSQLMRPVRIERSRNPSASNSRRGGTPWPHELR